MKKIEKFRDEYSFLSNFHQCTINYKGRIFPSTEHAYMSEKSDDPEWKDKCAYGGLTCKQVKGRSRRVKLVDNWDKIKFQVMLDVTRIKYSSNEELRNLLLKTGDAIIEEGNTWNDTVWGVDIRTGIGENHLGKIIMKVRDEFRKKPKVKWRVQEPPSGRYRSFYSRGWPDAEYPNQEICAHILCEDEYVPSEVKKNNHSELTLKVADHSVKPFVWRKVKVKFKTLKEAKEALISILKKYPYLMGNNI